MGNNLQVVSTNNVAPEDFKCNSVFEKIKEALQKEGATIVNRVNAEFGVGLKNSNGSVGTWVVNAKTGTGSIRFGGTASGDLTIFLSDDDLFSIVNGELNPISAYFQGRVQYSGNPFLLFRVKQCLP